MTEANSNTSSLTKQRQKQWQKLMVIPLVLQNKDKTMTEANSNTSSLTKQRQKQWQKLIVIPLVLQN